MDNTKQVKFLNTISQSTTKILIENNEAFYDNQSKDVYLTEPLNNFLLNHDKNFNSLSIKKNDYGIIFLVKKQFNNKTPNYSINMLKSAYENVSDIKFNKFKVSKRVYKYTVDEIKEVIDSEKIKENLFLKILLEKTLKQLS